MQLANLRELNVSRTSILLLSIFVFAFIYRIFLLLNQTYPPGSDIGFHASVINSITKTGNTNFLWNYYQMGGEIELEFPGYHIFASAVMFLTGMPNYVAQATVAATFSSLTILAVSLVTRLVWNETAAVIVAILVTFSPSDIDIICWGGYPNIIVLLMIPLTFYLFLKIEKLTRVPYIISASFLAASIFLTHSLSAAIFIGISATALLTVFIFPKHFGDSRKTILYWTLPIVNGVLLVSPFLVSAIPIYLNQSAIITGNHSVAQALVNNRTVSFELVLALFAGIGVYFWLSKQNKARFLALQCFLIMTWLLVPLLLTQGYLIGLYVDSVRFQFFFSYPAIIILAAMIDYASTRSLKGLSTLNLPLVQTKIPQRFKTVTLWFSNLPSLNSKTHSSVFIAVFLLVLLLILPIFTLPLNGVTVQRFYQVMDDKSYQAIEWIKENTPEGSVFASDMGFGWWLTGFCQRPTITDIDLQAISLANEVDISRNVSYILDTDYAIDNGHIQVREDGGYIGRNNPLITADVNWAHNPAPFFQFNSDNITLRYQKGISMQSVSLSQLPVTDMQLIDAKKDNPSIIINKANSDISFSKILTLSKGLRFVNITYVVQSRLNGVSLDSLNLLVNTTGAFEQTENTVTLIDQQNKACTQMIFTAEHPNVSLVDLQDQCIVKLTYNLQKNNTAVVQILSGITQLPIEEINSQAYLNQTTVISNAIKPSTIFSVTTFDYQKALRDYNVSYIVNIDSALELKYLHDPYFDRIWKNDPLSIYKVGVNTSA